ncbi:LPS-assembly protein LptD [Polycladidibacter hongkongensis]|uniref:LPS-assembly protein LptD n=1 Tax=Polycladidibacter hongkongensis TaxID=1647556 RepID=UPI00082DD215|nr:LPS-assembly protein LptD [Pseudovibrio hongkongensis]
MLFTSTSRQRKRVWPALAGLRAHVSPLALLLASGLITGGLSGAHAQMPSPDAITNGLSGKIDSSQPMLLEADKLSYNIDQDIITARGNVEIYFDSYTLEANRVVYNRKTARVSAHGAVRLTEPGGNVLTAEDMDLSDDMSAGFIAHLELNTPEFTKFLAEKAERKADKTTVLTNGVYSVYTNPAKPTVWRIKATEIVHRANDKEIDFDGAAVEFFGYSLMNLPKFTIADPSVKRASGFLTPSFVYKSRMGYGAAIPYFWAIEPNMDLTATLTPLSKQGVLGQLEWRHRLENGFYTFSTAAISQSDKSQFEGSSGDVRGRFLLNTTGQFQLSPNWSTGWNATYGSDKAVLPDYGFAQVGSASETSDIYLTGISERNRFDARVLTYQISQENYASPANPNNPSADFSEVGADLQSKQPVVHPVLDHSIVFGQSFAGGELNYNGNITSLTRNTTDAFSVNGTDRFRGVEGTFTRISGDLNWRRTFIDQFGQVITPFAYAKGSVYFLGSADKNVETLTDDAVAARAMPAVGIEYKYPWLARFNGGNQIIEPIAQIIARPDEQKIGELPNEDAQSIVFDASTLFRWDKFSGFDRNEGGVRANLGLRYKLQFDQGSFISAMAGRSFQLIGKNSYAVPDILDATGDSGLETSGSDYVASLYVDTNTGFRLGANTRLDGRDLKFQRAEVNMSGRTGPLTGMLGYAYLRARPDAGVPDDREELLGALNLKLSENWRAFGSARYDLINANVVQDTFGLGYDDEGLSLSVSYSEDRSRNNGETVDQIFYFRLGLRTLGDTSLSTSTSSK